MRVCCSRLALRTQKPEQDEGVQLVNAIYIMYRLVTRPLAGSIRARSGHLGRGRGHQQGKAGLSNTFLALEGGEEGRKCRWRLQIQKRGEKSLNNGTKLRLSPEEPPAGLGLGVTTVQSLQVAWLGH